MDVQSLYPSLKADQVAEDIPAIYLELGLEVEVDTHQLGLVLVMVAGREELVRQGLGHVTPNRRYCSRYNKGRGVWRRGLRHQVHHSQEKAHPRDNRGEW